MASSEKPQSKFTEVQGIKLHYLEWGETGKPDLLLVHGWTSFASSWSTVAEYFRGRFHIVALGDVDHPRVADAGKLCLQCLHERGSPIGIFRCAIEI